MKKKKSILIICGIILVIVACLVLTLFITNKEQNIEKSPLKIGALKGPTSMGLLFLLEDDQNGKTQNDYEFTMATGADELLPLMIKGDLDICLVPSNVASVLYNKTNGGVSVIDINTLGVLYVVSNNSEINSVADLKGKTILLTGEGTTPDFVLQYILEENNILDTCKLEYKSEASEVVSALANEDNEAVGLLPQPFVSAALAKNDSLKVVLDMNEEWEKINSDSQIVTGVTVVRNEVLNNRKEEVRVFCQEHKESVDQINQDPQTGADLAVKRDIVGSEAVALKAIPQCNIVCIDGETMKKTLEGYLEVIYEKSKDFIGGELPKEDFYYSF